MEAWRVAIRVGGMLIGLGLAQGIGFAQIRGTLMSRPLSSGPEFSAEARQCAQFPGADAGAKIAACIADLPPWGGTADARGLDGIQTIGTPIVITTPVRLLLGSGIYMMLGQGAIWIQNVRGGGIQGVGQGTILQANALSAAAILTIQSAQFVTVENLTLRGTVPEAVRLSNPSGGAYANTQHQFRNVIIDGTGGNIQYGVRICGTDGWNVDPCGDGSTALNNDLHYFENVTIDRATVAGVEMIASNHKNITFVNSNIVESGIGVSVNPRGNFFWYSGSMALNTDADFRIGTCNGEAIGIYNVHSERSHRFLRGTDFGDCLGQRVIIDGSSFGIDPATFAADHRAIDWTGAMSLIIRGSSFGNEQEDPTQTPMELYWHPTTSAARLNLQNNIVQTSRSNPFTGKRPTFSISNIRLSGSPASPDIDRISDLVDGDALQSLEDMGSTVPAGTGGTAAQPAGNPATRFQSRFISR